MQNLMFMKHDKWSYTKKAYTYRKILLCSLKKAMNYIKHELKKKSFG